MVYTHLRVFFITLMKNELHTGGKIINYLEDKIIVGEFFLTNKGKGSDSGGGGGGGKGRSSFYVRWNWSLKMSDELVSCT